MTAENQSSELPGREADRTRPDWRDESWLRRFPQLSTGDQDRRIQMAHRLMAAHDLDGVVLASPAHSHDFLGNYFAGEANPTVVIPHDGNPVAFQDGVFSPSAPRDLHVADAALPGHWIDEWHFNEGAGGIADLITGLGLSPGRLGFVGGSAVWPTTAYLHNGSTPWTQLPITYQLRQMLPQIEWIDVWPDLLPLVAVKSEQEIAQYAKASHLADRAARTFVDSLRVGGTQAEAMAQAAFDILQHGGYTPNAGVPFNTTQPIASGDVVTSEIVVYVGGIEAQAGVTVTMGPASEPMRQLIDAALHSYDLGLAAARPGMTMRQLYDEMVVPFRSIGAWGNTPLFHGLNPIYSQADVGHVNEADAPGLRTRFFPDAGRTLPFKSVVNPDLALRPGMTLHLEPSSQRGTAAVFLGSGLLITDDGAEEFGDITSRARAISA